MNYRPKLFLLLLAIWSLSACQDDKEGDPQPEFTQEDIETVDSQIANYMTTYNVPGASLAISKDGQLVYSKGYGLADKGTNEAVTVNHRFRIASISKTITSVAILKLIEEGKLTLDQQVFGEAGILETEFGSEPYNPDLLKITVNDLLRHTSGGWRNFVDDPCFTNKELSADELISWGLDNVPLAYEPGTYFHYSNFGYLLLGRIIEKVTDKSYENFVKDALLTPIGATRTQLAGNNESDRKNDEVKYYTQSTEEDPYTTYAITRNDAPLGWISTPSDMLLLATAIDGFDSRPDILNEETLTTLTTPAGFTGNHAKGIFTYNDPEAGAVWFHYGSLPGTHALFFRSESGYCVAFVTNSRFDADYSGSSDAMSTLLLNIINDEAIPWQDIDQF